MTTPITSTTVFRGRIVYVNVDHVRLPHGTEAHLEIVRHPGSVVLLAMPSATQVYLVRQYRYAVDRWLWELPAGSIDAGEAPEEAARRECEEEVGLAATEATRLMSFYPTPGYCDEQMTFYRLTGLRQPDRPAQQDPDEDLETRVVTLAEAQAAIRSGEIVDMKTVVGLSLLG